jgi:hypothetical protein
LLTGVNANATKVGADKAYHPQEGRSVFDKISFANATGLGFYASVAKSR